MNDRRWIRCLFDIIDMNEVNYFKLDSDYDDKIYQHRVTAIMKDGRHVVAFHSSNKDLEEEFCKMINFCENQNE